MQLALCILVHDKKLIEHLPEYGLRYTYRKVRRYNISAVVESNGKGEEELQSSDDLLIR